MADFGVGELLLADQVGLSAADIIGAGDEIDVPNEQTGFGDWIFTGETSQLVFTDEDYIDLVKYNKEQCNGYNSPCTMNGTKFDN